MNPAVHDALAREGPPTPAATAAAPAADMRQAALRPAWTVEELDDDGPPGPGFRWVQLAMAIVCMAAIANLQYGWTLFVDPIANRFGWSHAAIQTAFAVF